MRTTGSFVTSTTLGEAVRAFVPHPLPPADPPLDPACYVAAHHAAELALARLTGWPASCRPRTGCCTALCARKRC